MKRSAGKIIDRIEDAGALSQQSAPSPAPQLDALSTKAVPKTDEARNADHFTAAPLAATQEAERRDAERRETVRTQLLEPTFTALIERELFPRSLPFLVMALILAILAVANAAQSLPGVVAGLALVLSVAGVLPARRVWKAVARRSLAIRAAGAGLVIIAPLILFGFGIIRWTIEDGLAWDVSVAALLGVSLVAVVYLRRQPAMMFAAQFATWAAAGVIFSSLAGAVAGVGGMIVAVVMAREQMMQQRRETEFKRVQERIATRTQDILTDYEETGQGWFWEIDRRSLLTYISPPVAQALRVKPRSLIGQPLTHLFDLADTGEESERALLFHLSARSSFSELSVRAAIRDEERWWSVSGRPLYDPFGNFTGFRGSGVDLTERKRSQDNATRLARYDSLTGLANRYQMSQALEKILSAPQRSNRTCAVFLLDLDRFKQVNDTMGHPAGDALLQQVAQRIERAVGNLGQVGRIGGDEFQVIIPARIDRNTLAELGRDIINSISQPYSIDGQRVIIGVSTGIAIAPDDGDASDDIIRNADLALYAAKDGGRGRYHFYSEDLHANAEARSQMEVDLRDALANGELEMFYQPIISTATETITGFEALMRWHHPDKGWISPRRFIESAEDTGLIQQLGEWALRQACEQLANWPKEILVAVNVSPLQFANPQFPGIVANAIAQSGVDASQLELEITETVFLQDDAGTDAIFNSLKNLGVRLALDDFGTGYSSLGYLKKAPFDKIKIDQSFVRGITEECGRNGAIIASITSLA
ncbi:MAG: EAL domain-containing protein, partial [Alteraurantiacibacter sp.]